jgi:hypothetical protein
MFTLKPTWVTEAESVLAARQARREELIARLLSALPDEHPMREKIPVKPIVLTEADRRQMTPVKVSLPVLSLKFKTASA